MNYDFDDKEVFQEYLDEVFALQGRSGYVDTSIEVTSDDRIVTLSTCNRGIAMQRFMINAVLISEER